MATYRLDEMPPSAPLSTFADKKLPSFDQFVSSLEHMSTQRSQHQSSHQIQNRDVKMQPRLASPIYYAPQTAYEPERGGFLNILNPSTDQLRHPLAVSISPAKSLSSGRPVQTPRDAYEIRQGLSHGMKPIQPRGDVPTSVPSRDLPPRSSAFEHDLTLAGKPRKRSAQACQRCREMKIKCRVHGTGCITCMRQGLECTFEPAKSGLRQRRGKRNTDPNSDADHASTSDVTNSPSAKKLCATEQRITDKSKDASPATSFRMRTRTPVLSNIVATTTDRSVVELDQQGQGRERNTSSNQQLHRNVSTTSFSPTPPAEHAVESDQSSLRRISSTSMGVSRVELSSGSSTSSTITASSPPTPLAVDEDPFAIAPSLAISALRHFYSSSIHKQVTTSSFGDRYSGHGDADSVIPSLESVMVWHDKPTNERMLLYAILAAGAAAAAEAALKTSDREEGEMVRFSSKCRDAAELCLRNVSYMFDRVVVQTQLILLTVKVGAKTV